MRPFPLGCVELYSTAPARFYKVITTAKKSAVSHAVNLLACMTKNQSQVGADFLHIPLDSVEPYFDQDTLSELGFALESNVFGGKFDHSFTLNPLQTCNQSGREEQIHYFHWTLRA